LRRRRWNGVGGIWSGWRWKIVVWIRFVVEVTMTSINLISYHFHISVEVVQSFSKPMHSFTVAYAFISCSVSSHIDNNSTSYTSNTACIFAGDSGCSLNSAALVKRSDKKVIVGRCSTNNRSSFLTGCGFPNAYGGINWTAPTKMIIR